MKSTQLTKALQELSIACDMLQLEYPTLIIDYSLYERLKQESSQYESPKAYSSIYGINLRLKRKA